MSRIINSILLVLLLTIGYQPELFPKSKNNGDKKDIDNERPKIGLALSGGSALGTAHIGALKVIDSLNIPVDYIAGTSMGAIVGALYALGYSAEELEDTTLSINWTRLLSDEQSRDLLPFIKKKNTGRAQLELDLDGFTPKIPSGLISGQNVQLKLNSMILPFEGEKDFDNLPTPFRCVAVDLLKGEEIVLREGSLSKAVRSSMSIPTVFSPVEWDEHLLIDGGVINNFPVDVVREMGADYVIGLNLGFEQKTREDYNNLLDILERTTDIPRRKRLQENISICDIYIEQDVSGLSLMDFSHENIEQAIKRGEKAAASKIDELKALKQRLDKFPNDSIMILKRERLRQRINQLEKNPPMLYGIRIRGNEKLDFEFIYNNLGIKPGERFNIQQVENRINELYALGFFEKITYETENVSEDQIRLIIKVKERSLRKMRAGFKYDDFLKIVGLVGIDASSILFNGTRLELEYQFGGLNKFNGKFSYPSRSYDLPVYPFVDVNYRSIPINIYDNQGRKFAQYQNKAWGFGGGIGITFNRYLNLEIDYNFEFTDVTPEIAAQVSPGLFPGWHDKLNTIKASLIFDSLDEVIIPTRGVYLTADYERSHKWFGSTMDYDKFETHGKIFNTFLKKHTLSLSGSFMYAWGNLPTYKFFNFGGAEDFPGLDYSQVLGTKFYLAGASYRYEFKKDIFFKVFGNASFDHNFGSETDPIYGEPFFGYGAGIIFDSILGPLELTVAQADETPISPGKKETQVYFSAGYKF